MVMSQMVMSQRATYTDGNVIEELCIRCCHRRAMQMVMSQKNYADGDVTEELCRW